MAQVGDTFSIGRTLDDDMIVVSDGLDKPALKIDKNGIITENYRPFFSGCLSQTQHNKTISRFFAQLIPDNVTSNVGSHFNQTNGVFTAPVDGVYFFTANVLLTNLPSIKTNAFLSVNIGNKKYQEIDTSYEEDPYSISLFVRDFMTKGMQAWVEAATEVQSANFNQAVGFGGSPDICYSGITGGLT